MKNAYGKTIKDDLKAVRKFERRMDALMQRIDNIRTPLAPSPHSHSWHNADSIAMRLTKMLASEQSRIDRLHRRAIRRRDDWR